MKILWFFTLALAISLNSAFAKNNQNTLKVDQNQVNNWNNFASELYQIHLKQIKNQKISTKEETGGYGGSFANNRFYREISYYHDETKKLLSKIQWEIARPDTIHSIEVYLYDKKGRVKTDFYARYLPQARNAPIQTLINLHNYNDKLHAFRQFDANGELIYETCRGQFFDTKINLHLDDDEILEFRTESSDEVLNEAYAACFLNVEQTATAYLHPVKLINKDSNDTDVLVTMDSELKKLNQLIWEKPKNPLLYLKRGQLYFDQHEFSKAIDDYNTVLSLDASVSHAFFGRGMALARNGQIDEGIKDLSTFIKYNPTSSVAYTKRGVRYIWAGKLGKAQSDLEMAVKLDKHNSEAHDDLGVIYAQQKKFKTAHKHFSLSIQYDPTYQKAYHNLAMIHLLSNAPSQALIAINQALSLDSDTRNSLMLKSEILTALGKNKEAEAVVKKAEFLPEGNWSERFAIQ